MRTLKITVIFAVTTLLFIGCGKENLTPNSATFTAPNSNVLRFAANNNFLYAVSTSQAYYYSFTINSFIIADAANPSFVKSIVAANGAYAIAANTNNLFVGGQYGLELYDIANGAGPNFLGTYSAYRSCNPIAANNKFVFESVRNGASCSTGPSQVNVIDIATNPKQPKVLYSYPMTQPFGLAVDGDNLFVCDDGLKFYDISNPASPVLKQKTTINAKDVVAQNGKLIITGSDGLSQYDYSSGTLLFLSKLPNK